MGTPASNLISYHIILASKHWEPITTDLLRKQIQERIKRNLTRSGAIITRMTMGEEHLHILLQISADVRISRVVGWSKGECSHWINKSLQPHPPFYWQRGYFRQEVTPEDFESVLLQITTDAEMHKTISFSDQMKQLRQRPQF